MALDRGNTQLTRLARPVPAYQCISLARLEPQLGAAEDLDALAPGFGLAAGALRPGGADGDFQALDVELGGRSM